jgi:hypothetical protein
VRERDKKEREIEGERERCFINVEKNIVFCHGSVHYINIKGKKERKKRCANYIFLVGICSTLNIKRESKRETILWRL